MEMIRAAHASPADEAVLGALADLLAEHNDPRERWLRRHIYLRAKWKVLAERIKSGPPSKNALRKIERRNRRLTYALQTTI